MTDNKARLFTPLTMNPLHRHLDADRNQIESKASTKVHSSVSISSSSLASSSLSEPTSDPIIIEIIKPDKHKHNFNNFIPAFTKPYTSITQDTSSESATMMNLGPLKASFPQEGEISFITQPQFSHINYPLVGSEAGPHSIFPASFPKLTCSTTYEFYQPPQLSAILSIPHVHNKGFTQLCNSTSMTCQQQPVQGDKASHNSSASSETQSLHGRKSIPKNLDPPELLPQPSTKSRNSRRYIQGHQHYPLSKVTVVNWVNELRRYLFLWKTGRMSSAHAVELHHLLCTIEDKMAHPFLTPQVLGTTSLGKVMKSFRHGLGGHYPRSKEVAHRIIRYWRKVCLEA